MRGSLLAVAVGAVWGLAHGLSAEPPRAPAGTALSDRQETVLRLYVATRRCMRSAGSAAHRRGTSDPAAVQYLMVSVCGDPLVARLRYDGMTEGRAREYLVAMARTSYYEDVMRQAEPANP